MDQKRGRAPLLGGHLFLRELCLRYGGPRHAATAVRQPVLRHVQRDARVVDGIVRLQIICKRQTTA